MRRSLVIEVSVRLLYPSIIVLSLYFLFAGHNQPGGGFVGGLAAAAAISLRYVAGGVNAVRNSFRFKPWTIIGTGLAVSVGTAIFPMLLGGAILEHGTLKLHPPVLGEVKATSALPFDLGVYAIVIGLVLMIFEAFGEDADHELDKVEAPTVPAASALDEYRDHGQHASASTWLSRSGDDDDDAAEADVTSDAAGGVA
ncbi:MAG: MnhB domain-containing protein [Ilumatobacter sp.]|uniref:MnhB domain-containing protein n=1 Tax=Ilumatobacter sp. TaxID=1967498 RepID=UPI003C73B188